MSDYQDPDLDISIDLNMDDSKMEKAHKHLSAIETAWNKLSSLPSIDLSQKIRMAKMVFTTRNESAGKFGIFSADLESTLSGNNKQSQALDKLSYSWDAIYDKELRLLQNKEKQEKTLGLLSSSVHEKMKHVPAPASGGNYHPLFAQGEGGLVRHSKAVAQTAYGLAGLLNVKGDKDRFVIAGLTHDMWKLGPEGNSTVTDPKHGQYAADALSKVGLGAEAGLAGPHMGNWSKGPYKNAPKISKFDQRLLSNADWLMSRPYAQQYVTWGEDGKNIQDINIKGLREESVRRGEATLQKNGLLMPVSEEQEKMAESAKKWENSWHSVRTTAGQLIGILKTLGGLGLAALYTGIKETSAGAALMTGGLGMFTGTTEADILSNSLREAKTWGKSTGSIDKAVARLSAQRGQFKLTGAGDLLPMAMAGNIEGLMLSDKPMQQVYGEIIDMFTQQLKGTKDQAQRDKLLALVQSNLGPEAAALVNTQATLGQNWTQLGDRTSPVNGFLDWTKQVMEVNSQMQTSINGIKDTWRGLFVTFQELFGNPFLAWLDNAFRKLGVELDATMQSKKGEQAYYGLYNSLTPEQRRRMMEGSLLGKYDEKMRLAERGFTQEMGLAGNVSRDEINAMRVSEGYQPFNDLAFRTGSATIKSYAEKVKLARAKAIAAKYGVPVNPSDSYYDINRKVEAAGLAAVGNQTFGMEVPGINSMPMATAENWTMFNTLENRKRFPKALGIMDQLPSITDTARTSNAFDSVIQGIMDGLQTGVFSEEMVLPALNNYLEAVKIQKEKDSNKTSMYGAPVINMQFSLPNGSDPRAVSQGILDAVGRLPGVIENSYLSRYAGGYG